jgi:hypothetical protein
MALCCPQPRGGSSGAFSKPDTVTRRYRVLTAAAVQFDRGSGYRVPFGDPAITGGYLLRALGRRTPPAP